jgi:homoserine kinase
MIRKKSVRKKSLLPASLHLSLPATSANLGPAFDAAALAMDLYITIDAKAASEFHIIATGRDRAVCQELENHLILNTYREVLQNAGAEIIPLSLRIANGFPIGKGCGSSAAARLAGIALANHFGQLGWSDAQIIAEGSRREKHSDNVAACWLGGLTVARMSADGQAHAACVRPKGKWPLLLAVPEEVLPTEQARRVLPDQYSRADVVSNVQNSMLLLAAFSQGRQDLLAAALEDRIHQPYRATLCPLLPALQPLTGKPGVLGVAISGAGPSVLIFLDSKVPVVKVKKAISAQLAAAGLKAELIPTSIALRGAQTSHG